MPSRVENQLAFAVEGDRFRVPKRIHHFRGGQEVVDFCSQREAWKQPGGKVLFKDLEEDGPFFLVNPNTWQVEGEIDPALVKRRIYTGVIITTPSLSDETAWLAAGPISESVNVLRLESPVIVVETKGEGFDEKSGRDLREAVFKEAGLVKRRILTSVLDNSLVWQGRLRKKVNRKLVNLIASDRPFEKLQILRGHWQRMEKDYWKNGFRIVDRENSEILECLRFSNAPIFDIQRLKLGFGVEIINVYCGCHKKANLKGVWDEIWLCGKDHEKEGYVPREKQKRIYTPGETVLKEGCFHCTNWLIEDVRLVADVNRGRRKRIQVDIKCPTHGLISGRSGKRIISAKQWQLGPP